VAVEGTTELLPSINIGVNATAGEGYVSGSLTTLTFSISTNGTFANTVVTGSTVDATGSDAGTDKVKITTTTAPGVYQVTVSNTTGITTAALASGINLVGLRVNASAATAQSITVTPGLVPSGNVNFATTLTISSVATTSKSITGAGVEYFADTTISELASVPSSQTKTPLSYVLAVSFSEGEPTLFKTAADYSVGITEVATQGTRIAVTFNNLNANVNYYVPATISTGAQLSLSAFSAAVGGTALTAITTGAGTATVGQPGYSAAGLVALPAPVGGSSTIYYGVTVNDGGTAGAFAGLGTTTSNNANGYPYNAGYATIATIPAGSLVLVENVPSASAVTTTLSTPVSVALSLVGPTTGYPEFATVSYTATATTGASGTNGLLDNNSTVIIFPYVISSGGYDTGIAITNASAANAATAATGNCTLTFFGSPTVAQFTFPTVFSAATSLVQSIDGLSQFPGFQGYIQAVCNFAGAHGFAFISNGVPGTTSYSATSYLGVVTEQNGTGGAQGVPAVTAE
jgi:hypothetical protein